MKIHEYQAKAILKKYGVAVPRGETAETVEQADMAAKSLFGAGATGVVVKAQIHAGGRGKGGGVKIAKSVDEAKDFAGKMLGMNMVTEQTGPGGRVVRRLLIDRKSTRLNSSHRCISYAVFCLKKKIDASRRSSHPH